MRLKLNPNCSEAIIRLFPKDAEEIKKVREYLDSEHEKNPEVSPLEITIFGTKIFSVMHDRSTESVHENWAKENKIEYVSMGEDVMNLAGCIAIDMRHLFNIEKKRIMEILNFIFTFMAYPTSIERDMVVTKLSLTDSEAEKIEKREKREDKNGLIMWFEDPMFEGALCIRNYGDFNTLKEIFLRNTGLGDRLIMEETV